MPKLANCRGLALKLLPSSKMPAFTLYGSRGSTNTDRVRLTLAEGGFTDYELVLLNLQKGEQKVSGLFRSGRGSTLFPRKHMNYCLECQTCFLALQTMVPLPATLGTKRANNAALSSRNIRNVIRGAKYR